MNKKVIYTAIYGNKDTLKDPLYHNKDFDYICFTDNKEIKSDIWTIQYLAPKFKDPVRNARLLKTKPHELFAEYDLSIWIDANFLICDKLDNFLQLLGPDANLVTFQHDQGRDCIYEEAEAVIQLKKDNPEIVSKQIQQYKEEGYPVGLGLTTTSVLLRRHNEEDMKNLGNLWWNQIQSFSRRDQLSFYYCKWKLNTKMYMLRFPNYNIRSNTWFRWLPHNYETQAWSF
jgi:hypothetical protein